VAGVIVAEVPGFSDLAGQLDYPMLIVTTAAGGERAGCLVGFHTQCSIDPSRLLVCISRANHTYGVAARSELLAVHFLDRANYQLSVLFGEQTGDTVDKFEVCSWRKVRGMPILTEAKAWLIGRVLDRFEFGDHTGHLLEPVQTHLTGRLDQLPFQQVKTMQPGHPA
jgi:flavin reductase (DIM6/NTAB) family NADH-FMN oxidoreductase RutF